MTTFFLDMEAGDDGLMDFSNRRWGTPTYGNNAYITTGKWAKAAAFSGGSTSSSSYIYWSGTNIAAFQPQAQFTIECWAYWVSHSATTLEVLMAQYSNGSSSNSWELCMTTAGKLAFLYSTNGSNQFAVEAAYTPTTGQWIHIAVDRDGSGVIRVYADGVLIASATDTATISSPQRSFVVGNDDTVAKRHPGYICDVRYTNGIARYANGSGFTPPAAAHGTSKATDTYFENVVLLMPCIGDGTGTSFAMRWRTLGQGGTTARLASGDTVKYKSAQYPTLLGNATWTDQSKTVTLAGAVNATIYDCAAAWTASTNVTTSTTSACKEGSACSTFSFGSSFTTGLAAYKALGSAIDFSAYQQVSFWFYCDTVIGSGVWSLRLCSDTAGVTTVNTIPIPVSLTTGYWQAVTVDLGANLGSSIQSVALYCEQDPGTPAIRIDNIIACKASSSADALTLTSVIGKVWNLPWVASSTYASNTIRKPTPPNRNGYRYKVTAGGGGAAGSSEPTWPAVIGATVTDGALTWTCEGVEDTWYPIKSISGTTVLLDSYTQASPSEGRGYSGTTETVASYKFEPTRDVAAPSFNSTTTANTLQVSGVTLSGGWDRTAMTTQDGETWLTGNCGWGALVAMSSKNDVTVRNLHGIRYSSGFSISTSYGLKMYSITSACSGSSGFTHNNSSMVINGMTLHSNVANQISAASTPSTVRGSAWAINNMVNSFSTTVSLGAFDLLDVTDLVFKNNDSNQHFGGSTSERTYNVIVRNMVTAGNTNNPINATAGGITFINSTFAEATPFATMSAGRDNYIWSQKHQGTADNHLGTTDGGTIISATDQRHTASGISWKFRPTSTSRSTNYPLRMPIAKVACAANTARTVSLWVRRDSTNIAGRIVLRGGQLTGAGDANTACAPSINTWTQYSLTFTPTEAGVVEMLFECFDGIGTTNSLWIDDLAVS